MLFTRLLLVLSERKTSRQVRRVFFFFIGEEAAVHHLPLNSTSGTLLRGLVCRCDLCPSSDLSPPAVVFLMRRRSGAAQQAVTGTSINIPGLHKFGVWWCLQVRERCFKITIIINK